MTERSERVGALLLAVCVVAFVCLVLGWAAMAALVVVGGIYGLYLAATAPRDR